MIGERVAERIDALGLSQAELARRIGISQQAVGKLINGGSTGSRYLHRFARELATTPAYLAGETEDPNSEMPDEPVLDHETREMVGNFVHLAPADRRALLQIARSMAGGAPPSDTVHAGGGVAKAAKRQSQSQSQSVHAPKQGYNGPPPDDEGET